MADKEQTTPATTETKPAAPDVWRPFESLRREVDRLFEDFDRGFFRWPPRALAEPDRLWGRAIAPAVDIVEREADFQVTAELPGMAEKDIEVRLANGVLTIKGEKKEEKEEKRKGYHLSERRYGSFERSFRVPDGVDAEKIAADFSKGVLTVTLPKRPEAMKAERKIEVKPG